MPVFVGLAASYKKLAAMTPFPAALNLTSGTSPRWTSHLTRRIRIVSLKCALLSPLGRPKQKNVIFSEKAAATMKLFSFFFHFFVTFAKAAFKAANPCKSVPYFFKALQGHFFPFSFLLLLHFSKFLFDGLTRKYLLETLPQRFAVCECYSLLTFFN